MLPIIDMQTALQAECGQAKREFVIPEKDVELVQVIEPRAAERLREAALIPTKVERSKALRAVKHTVFDELGEELAERRGEIFEILGDLQKKICRQLILEEGRRIDGRQFDEVRPINCEVGLLPRPHGSALFTRGETQILTIATLGTPGDAPCR